jgi:cell division septation protein DedD
VEERTKQRLVGVLVFIGALFIILPFLFHNSKPPIEHKSAALVTPSVATASTAPQSAPAPVATPVVSAANVPAQAQVQQVQAAPTSIPATPNPAAVTPASAAAPAPTANTQMAATPDAVTSAHQVMAENDQPMPSAPAANALPKTDAAMKADDAALKADAAIPADAAPVKKSVRAAAVVPKEKVFVHRAAADSTGAWTIQIGAFSQYANAAHLISELREHHFHVYTHELQHDGRKLTTVFVGPERNIEHARLAQSHLRSELKLNGVLKRY